jgi:hypothetical protein
VRAEEDQTPASIRGERRGDNVQEMFTDGGEMMTITFTNNPFAERGFSDVYRERIDKAMEECAIAMQKHIREEMDEMQTAHYRRIANEWYVQNVLKG